MSQIETRVTSKLMSEIEPSLRIMQKDIQDAVGTDLCRLVQEELAIQKCKEATQKPGSMEESKGQEEAVSKTQESPKRKKMIKLKKI